mmetsp:Transcript_183/g.286  ORF Transcript_183/g.286 Transcript_183/m.286 type:complete len:370 (-) Transcript_183:56-1165(-)
MAHQASGSRLDDFDFSSDEDFEKSSSHAQSTPSTSLSRSLKRMLTSVEDTVESKMQRNLSGSTCLSTSTTISMRDREIPNLLKEVPPLIIPSSCRFSTQLALSFGVNTDDKRNSRGRVRTSVISPSVSSDAVLGSNSSDGNQSILATRVQCSESRMSDEKQMRIRTTSHSTMESDIGSPSLTDGVCVRDSHVSRERKRKRRKRTCLTISKKRKKKRPKNNSLYFREEDSISIDQWGPNRVVQWVENVLASSFGNKSIEKVKTLVLREKLDGMTLLHIEGEDDLRQLGILDDNINNFLMREMQALQTHNALAYVARALENKTSSESTAINKVRGNETQHGQSSPCEKRDTVVKEEKRGLRLAKHLNCSVR